MTRKPFTLIEILVAIAIFVSAMAPLLMVLTDSSTVFRNNVKKLQATMFASEFMARIQAARSYDACAFIRDPTKRLVSNASLTEVSGYNGLYFVATGDNEVEHLGILKLGISYRKQNAAILAGASYDKDTRRLEATAALNGQSDTGVYLEQHKIKQLRNTRHLFLQDPSSGHTDPTKYRIVSCGNLLPDLRTMDGVVGAPTGTYDVYLLDDVFTLWITDL